MRTGNLKSWISVFTISIGSFTTLLSSTTIEVAFPNLMSAFGMELKLAQWTVTLYMIVMSVSMLMAADMVRRFGVNKTAVFSFILFIIATWLGGGSESVEMLLLGRGLQGFSSGLQAPLAAIVVANGFPKERIGFAMGIYGLVMLMAPALGPVVGGLLIDHFSWRLIFYFQIPLALVSLFLSLLFLPQEKKLNKASYDWNGLFVLILLVSVFFVFVSKLLNGDREFLYVLLLFIFLSLFVFIYIECKISNPLVNIGMLKNIPFSINLIVIFLLSSGMFSTILLVPIYMIETLHMSPGAVGISLLPAGLVMAITSPLGGRMSDKYPPYIVIIPGLLLFSFSSFYLSTFRIGNSLSVIIISSVVGRIGLSLLLPSLYANSFKALDGKYTEYASSILNFVRQIGASVGILVFSTYYSDASFKHSQRMSIEVSIYSEGLGFYESLLETAVSGNGLVGEELRPVLNESIHNKINLISDHIAFIDVFYTIGVITLVCVLAWLISFLLWIRGESASTGRDLKVSVRPTTPKNLNRN